MGQHYSEKVIEEKNQSIIGDFSYKALTKS